MFKKQYLNILLNHNFEKIFIYGLFVNFIRALALRNSMTFGLLNLSLNANFFFSNLRLIFSMC
jgi:hypothetical protein